ncbi:MAG: Adaptor for signal transduction [Caeruleum heppii]|nr:MAG: Adaptor for signal transduction [Caeruleum heppii]
MAFSKTYHDDSDADDEYERSMPSPHLMPDSDTSPIDSDPQSNEHTPTTYGYHANDRMPSRLITDWSAEECADYVSGLNLSQYSDAFLENEIVGEALIEMKHDELKELGMNSVGHRLTLLKSVYDVKIKQDVPIETDHYVPLSAETDMQDATATQADIARIIDSIRLRDERIIKAEAELIKITEEYRKLREELLPVFLMAKGPLPPHPEITNHQDKLTAPTISQLGADKLGGSLSRKFSTKKLWLGSVPKNNSPTHPAIQETKVYDTPTIDPSEAAKAASNHLTTTMTQAPQLSPGHAHNMPSPTSPPSHRTPPMHRSTFNGNDDNLPRDVYASSQPNSAVERDRGGGTPAPSTRRGAPEPEMPSSASTAPSVEIFKSFKVSMEDPCYKVLPAALKKYNINADWKQYALYIVYGDEERCLELDEKPLNLFKQLDKEGRKPMFMLRKMAQAEYPGSAGSGSSFIAQQNQSFGGGGGGRGPQYQSGVQLVPGGVL